MSAYDRLRAFILNDLTPLESSELHDDARLPQDVLDSLGIAEVLVFIEDEIGRKLDPSEETETTVGSINAIVSFIEANRIA